MFRFVAVMALLALSGPAHAMTAADVAEKMTAQQRNAWAFGAADMAAHLFQRMGDAERARCTTTWIESRESVREIDAALGANPTARAAAVIEALTRRHCGEYQ